MKFVSILALLLLTSFANANAAEQDEDDKEPQQVSNYYENTQPIRSYKPVGVEVNLFRLLALSNDHKTFSGTLSYFDRANNIEIAIPVYAESTLDMANKQFRTASVDIHLRKFMNQQLSGVYISGFTRGAALQGTVNENWSWLDGLQGATAKQKRAFKLGVGVGVGYRAFSDSGLYWGASFSAGRFLTQNNDQFISNDILFGASNDAEYIFDIEFLKFGYAF